MNCYRAIVKNREGEQLASDQFAAEDAIKAVDFADKRAPEGAASFTLCNGAGREIGDWPL